MVDKAINFPVELLHPDQKALCLFASAFGGGNDVRHLKFHMLKDVELVDNDAKTLREMDLYGYKLTLGDAFKVIAEKVLNREKYDIVVSDQWTNMDELIHGKWMPELKALCRGWLIVGLSQTYLNEHPEYKPERMMKRSDYRGGVYWVIIDCHKKDA